MVNVDTEYKSEHYNQDYGNNRQFNQKTQQRAYALSARLLPILCRSMLSWSMPLSCCFILSMSVYSETVSDHPSK